MNLDTPTLGKATQHSGGRTLSGLGLEGDEKHLASLDIGQSWRKGHQDSLGKRMAYWSDRPDTTCPWAVTGRAQRTL